MASMKLSSAAAVLLLLCTFAVAAPVATEPATGVTAADIIKTSIARGEGNTSTSLAVSDAGTSPRTGPLSAALYNAVDGSLHTVVTCGGALMLVVGVMMATFATEQPLAPRTTPLRRRVRPTAAAMLRSD